MRHLLSHQLIVIINPYNSLFLQGAHLEQVILAYTLRCTSPS